MKKKKTARSFASKFLEAIQKNGKTQRQISEECRIPASTLNRLCKDGTGDDDHIAVVLQRLRYRRDFIGEMLQERRAELSDGPAKNIWQSMNRRFIDEDEYLSEICPFPLERAFACTHHNIHITDVIKLAQECGISEISQKEDLNYSASFKFFSVFSEKYGKEASKDVLSPKCSKFPPVLMFDFEDEALLSDYRDVYNCNGKLYFHFPHMVFGDYVFKENGILKSHRHNEGVEFLYSLEGDFQLMYDGKQYPTNLSPTTTIFVLDARRRHSITLLKSSTGQGRLLMARFYPKKRNLTPGKAKKHKKLQPSRNPSDWIPK